MGLDGSDGDALGTAHPSAKTALAAASTTCWGDQRRRAHVERGSDDVGLDG
ncbi:hypothetical protein [Pseudonocardia yunnanensis]|uniref:Uncharacterized protein n=2 Tax=Pseudonocardia yunnanensis TaxID=58107 RepID=A0ABW4EWD9_9PSEU